jgi:hypothetical protein
MLALMGHLSQQMMEHYPHIRMAAKREAVEILNITAKPRGHVRESPEARPKPVVQRTVSDLKEWSHPPGLNRRPADYEMAGGSSMPSIVSVFQSLMSDVVLLRPRTRGDSPAALTLLCHCSRHPFRTAHHGVSE